MTEREMFMYEIWKRTMELKQSDKVTIHNYPGTWELVKSFWIPFLEPLAIAAGY